VAVTSGLVVKWPREVYRVLIEYLFRQEAQRSTKLWQGAATMYKTALGRCLTEPGLTAVQASSGRVTERPRVLERVRPVAAWYELTREQVAAIWACTAMLDAKIVAALAAAGQSRTRRRMSYPPSRSRAL